MTGDISKGGAKDEEMAPVVAGNGELTAEQAAVQKRTACSIFVGDFLHNMADGFFIGAAFKLCDNSMGWTVAMGAFAHELAQELADFFVLVGPGGMSVPKAILLNVVSGMSVTLGGIIMTATDVGDGFTGNVLIFGAGAYFYIGCVEAVPRAFYPTGTVNMKMVALLLYIVGAACIAFVLFGHEHCAAGHAH